MPLTQFSHDQLFESAFHHAAIGMALVAPDGRWLKTNPALTRIIGYTEAELLKIDFQTITHPDDLGADLEYLEALLAGHIPDYQMEKRYFHKKGTIIWVQLSVSLVQKEDGSPGFFISQIQDITDRKIAEAERDAFFMHSVDMLAIADTKGYLTRVNPAWTESLGWTSDELVSRPYVDFLHPDDLERTKKEAERVYAGEDITPFFTNRYRTKHGDYRWLEWSACESSPPDRIYCCVRDITDKVEAAESLRLSELRFQDLAANVPGMVYQFEWHPSGKHRFTYVSPKSYEILGVNPQELIADYRGIADLLHADDVEGHTKTLDDCSIHLKYRYWEGRHVRRDGRTVWTSLSAMPRAMEGGGVLWTGLIQDITEQKQLNQKIADSENLYRSLVNSLAEGVMLINANETIQACNQSAQKILGLSEKEILSRTISDTRWAMVREDGKTLPYEDRPGYLAVRKGQSVKNRILGVETPDKGLRWLSISAEPLVKDGESIPYAAVTSFFDITDIKALTEKLELQAHVDFLTGAYNRGHFYELASLELTRAKRYKSIFTLMMLDLDHFKIINDKYGHDAGDRALKQFVRVLKDTLRDMDIIGRFGGEEFIVLLPETSITNAMKLAERLLKLVSDQPIEAGNQTFFMTVSIGLAQLNEDIKSMDDIVKRTDKALYMAKQNGRNCAYYDPEELTS